MGLSFRVRDGTGRFPHAMIAVTLVPVPLAPGGVRGWEICVVTTCAPAGPRFLGAGAGVVLLFSCGFVPRATKPGDGFVGWEPHSGRKQSCFFLPSSWCERLLNPFTEGGVWCKLSAY